MRAVRRALIAIGVVLAAGLAGVGWQVSRLVRPARVPMELNPNDFLVSAEDVEFDAADGVPLKGWYLPGRSRAPGLLLCHGLGANRAALMHLVLPLRKAGYHILLFDFRAHGESAGRRSTLGIDEAQDVLGAADFLARQSGVDSRRLGGWGKGTGAYALALAARERPQIRALALDSLFPDPRFLIAERLYASAGPLREPLAWLASLEFNLIFGPRHPQPSVAAALDSLKERSVFFVVSREQRRQAQAARALMEAIPEGKDAEKNLLELEASWSQNLYGEDKARYEREVRRFFLRALPPEPVAHDDRPVQVLEG